jgi:hypothetical protein
MSTFLEHLHHTTAVWFTVAFILSGCSDTVQTTSPGKVIENPGEFVGPTDAGPDVDSPDSSRPDASRNGPHTIGPAGGEIVVDGMTLVIPPGALERNVDIEFARAQQLPPSLGPWLRDDAPIYQLGPSGTQFARPVQILMTIPASAGFETAAELRDEYPGALWTDGGQIAHVPLDLARSGEGGWVLIAQNTHFSLYGFMSWRHYVRVGENLVDATLSVVEVAGKTVETFGAVAVASLCAVRGRGNVGEPPCRGPLFEAPDGTVYARPLCLGPVFTGGKTLEVKAGVCVCVDQCGQDCGEEGQGCCDGGGCNQGLECNGSTCEMPRPECGEEGDPCCEGPTPCHGELVCDESSFECVEPVLCGGEGDVCCDEGDPCDEALECDEGVCVACPEVTLTCAVAPGQGWCVGTTYYTCEAPGPSACEPSGIEDPARTCCDADGDGMARLCAAGQGCGVIDGTEQCIPSGSTPCDANGDGVSSALCTTGQFCVRSGTTEACFNNERVPCDGNGDGSYTACDTSRPACIEQQGADYCGQPGEVACDGNGDGISWVRCDSTRPTCLNGTDLTNYPYEWNGDACGSPGSFLCDGNGDGLAQVVCPAGGTCTTFFSSDRCR